MKSLSATTHSKKERPVTILQFGEGNFLRAFFDMSIHHINSLGQKNYGVTIVNSFPQSQGIDLTTQDCLYTVVESSSQSNKSTVVDCVQEHFSLVDEWQRYLDTALNLDINVIVSNTTEAGITYLKEDPTKPKTFPARLTCWLLKRFEVLQQANRNDKVYVLPCELIESNGSTLKQYILQHAQDWKTPASFIQWVESCYFYDTLVDRIVPGYPKNFIDDLQKQWGYQDRFAILTEDFFLFAIQGDTQALDLVLPFSKIPLNVVYTQDLAFYRNRKVAVLNGAHTLLANIALLCGENFVADTVTNPVFRSYLHQYLYQDVAPTLGGDVKEYIEFIFQRFENKYLEHRWESISLNSLAKFNTRNMPTLMVSKEIPHYGLFALSSIWYRYTKSPCNDTQYAEFDKEAKKSHSSNELVANLVSNKALYPSEIPQAWIEHLVFYYEEISKSPLEALKSLLNKK